MVLILLGISTSFFSFQGLDIYSSVARARELGFKAVELGAAHKFEENIFDTLSKVKKDFGDLQFTLHGFFPPQPTPFWFNSCEGLSARNKTLLNELFRAADLMEAEVASIHVGSFNRLRYDASNVKNGMIWEINEGAINREKALLDFKSLIAFSLKKAEEIGVDFAIENIFWRISGIALSIGCRPRHDGRQFGELPSFEGKDCGNPLA
jgi:sugar phosphate isomerase/epimerase